MNTYEKNSLKKIPIDDNGKGNCCPVCGSLQISVDYQYGMQVEKDLNTDKEIFRNNEGRRIYRPTDKHLARLYKSNRETQMWIFRCRKCGWLSETFAP